MAKSKKLQSTDYSRGRLNQQERRTGLAVFPELKALSPQAVLRLKSGFLLAQTQ
jgi:hypothetical protein